MIVDNPVITYPVIASTLSISVPTISRAIGRFLEEGVIIRQGSKKTGYWQLTDKGKKILLKQ